MTRSLLAGSLFVFAFAACGTASEEELISDGELGEVQTARSQLTVATVEQPSPQLPAAFHLRLTWGLLGGNMRTWQWVNWTGGLKVDSGSATLEHLIFFDNHDMVQKSDDPTQVRWSSRTGPHFDGVVVKVQPGAATDKLHVTTPLFTRDFDTATLAAGIEQRFDVDAAGHQISVTAIPQLGCGGFAFGYQRKSSEGWLGFAGLLTDESGANQGIIRFRAEGGVIQARLMGKDGNELAAGKGTLDGERFEFALGGLGTVKGFFQPANAFSPRGSFQGSLACK